MDIDRCRTSGPAPGFDLRWSGEHDNHGGNVQVVTAPDGWPLGISPVHPGREHDATAQRHHGIPPLLTAWTGDQLRVLGELGYEGEQGHHHRRVQNPTSRSWTDIQ
ncbi:transposase family protein [Winogradskya consettensis]|uniref:transposase family protein n=1 Tax=Winogradskya consettensis TaxID=113560 RepID=UPI002458B0B0|nr:transposase family protein [Actinoplanes consettensis]